MRSDPPTAESQGTRRAHGEGALSVCVLGSGSRGNSTYVSDGATSILIDAGFSARETGRRLRALGIDPGTLRAILLTHEHGDHVRGVERLSRLYRLPVFMTAGTRRAALLPAIADEVETFTCGRPFRIATLEVHPFSISHDAADPSGFTIESNGCRLGIATDLGRATAVVREHLRGCRMVILEANHDPRMLIEGPYPWFLKQRIQGRTGHLSNGESCRLLAEILECGLTHVILAHLSETNNTPQMALAEASPVLAGTGIRLEAASQGSPTALIGI
jgi:phosphoribosyl 1,2-cyclic phosphodiesterase